MQIRKRLVAWVLAGAYFVWTVVLQPIWNLNVEKYAQQQKMDGALSNWSAVMKTFWLFVSYIPSSFGLGFVVGALIFAYWDWIAARFRHHVLRKPSEEIEATPPEIKAWVGNMTPHFDPKDPSMASFVIRVLNFGSIPFSIKSVAGSITLTHANGERGRLKTRLDPPFIRPSDSDLDDLPPGRIATIILHQPLPPAIRRLMPDIFSWSPWAGVDFKELDIQLVSGELQKQLKVWESMRLSTGDWQVRGVETFQILKDDNEAAKFRETMQAVAAIDKKYGED